jgi:hypothetical protein
VLEQLKLQPGSLMRPAQIVQSLRRRLAILKDSGPGSLRFYTLWKIGSLILPDYHFRFLQLDWRNDEDFKRYLARFDQQGGLDGARRWTVHQLIRLVGSVPGDTAECGVLNGAMSYIICKANEVSAHRRLHFLFDSFEGLSAPGDGDGSYWRQGDLTAGADVVEQNLRDCRDFRLMKGWIPARFEEVADRRFAFVHIDVDLYQPTRDSLEFFYPRMSEGGIMLLDDYASSFSPGATQAAKEVLDGKPEQVISLADGGGFLIKGNRTAVTAELSARAHR